MLSFFPAELHARRDRFLTLVCIGLVTILAWTYLVHLHRQMSIDMEYQKSMAAMGMTARMPWTAADAFFTFAMWTVMMAGMMVPSASPVLLLFAATRAGSSGRGVSLATLAFGLGYVMVWTGFSVVASLAQYGLHESAMLSMSMSSSSNRLSGAILIAAGAYQLTPWKSRCLTHCRSPLGFLMTNWYDGIPGAFRMGFRHGAYCLGCCWALMSILFAVGVMNLVWIAALTGFVLLEKLGPAGATIARVAGAVIVALGIVVIT